MSKFTVNDLQEKLTRGRNEKRGMGMRVEMEGKVGTVLDAVTDEKTNELVFIAEARPEDVEPMSPSDKMRVAGEKYNKLTDPRKTRGE